MNDGKHWILRVGDGENFVKGNPRSLWYVNDGPKYKTKTFLANVQPGDKLWFLQNKLDKELPNGHVIAVAEFVSKNKITNEDNEIKKTLNFTGEEGGDCNIEIHYTNLYNLTALNLYTGQKRGATIQSYDNVKAKLPFNLPDEYKKIVFYSQITNRM
jgi:hypothetical protein